MRLNLARIIPPNSEAAEHPQGLGIVYKYTIPGRDGKQLPAALAYAGKAKKASWQNYFLSEAEREKRIETFFAGGYNTYVRSRRCRKSWCGSTCSGCRTPRFLEPLISKGPWPGMRCENTC